MNNPYLPILLVILFGISFSGIFLILSALIGPRKRSRSPAKFSVYECGQNPIGDAREPVDVKFCLVAMLFIVFDIETVFLFPWSILYREFIADGQGLFMLIEMGIFIFILALGLLFIWRKGALDWK